MKSQRAKLIAIAVFTFLDIVMAFFIDSRTIFAQTIYGMSKVVIFIIFIDMIKLIDLEWRFLKIVLYSYWGGFILLYIVNATKYKDFDEWLVNFNNYENIQPVMVGAVLFATLYAVKKLK